MKVTKMEADILNLIAHDLYQPVNGSRPENFSDTGAVWTFSVADSAKAIMQPRQFAGVCSGLKKKGLISCYKGTNKMLGGTNQDPDTITLTETGLSAWAGLFPAEAK